MAVALLIAVAIEGAIAALCLWIWLKPESAPVVEKALTKRVPVAVMFQGGSARKQAANVVEAAPSVLPPVARKKAKVVARMSPEPELVARADDAEAAPVADSDSSKANVAQQNGGNGNDSALANRGDDVDQANAGEENVSANSDAAGAVAQRSAGGAGSEIGTLEGRDLSRYAVVVLSELTANRRVPLQATRMRLQGSAMLELHIGTHGELEQVTLVKSSGHAVLDDAALQTARDSAPFPAPPGNLLARFTVPIRYFE